MKYFVFVFGSSDGYTDQDVVYRWTSGRGVNIASDMKLSQFDLISTPTGNATGMTTDFNFILITFLKKAPIELVIGRTIFSFTTNTLNCKKNIRKRHEILKVTLPATQQFNSTKEHTQRY